MTNIREFKDVQIGQTFTKDGVIYMKRSSRTAEMIDRDNWWYYFSNKDIVSTDLRGIEFKGPYFCQQRQNYNVSNGNY